MRAGHGRHGSPFQPTRMLRLTDPIMDGWPSLPRGGPSYREAKGGALRPGRVAERWDKIPWFSRLVAVQCDSISTTPPSPATSQRPRTGVSALHKPILPALHQSTLYWVAVNIAG